MPRNSDTVRLILFICHAGHESCFLSIIYPFSFAKLYLHVSNVVIFILTSTSRIEL